MRSLDSAQTALDLVLMAVRAEPLEHQTIVLLGQARRGRRRRA